MDGWQPSCIQLPPLAVARAAQGVHAGYFAYISAWSHSSLREPAPASRVKEVALFLAGIFAWQR